MCSVLCKAQCTSLIFSEYYEGSFGSNKALEFYNSSTDSLLLSDYEVRQYSNGALVPTRVFEFPEFYLKSHFTFSAVSSSQTVFSDFDTTWSLSFNGNDALELVYLPLNEVVDVIGQVGENPSSGAWAVGDEIKGTMNFTIKRDSTVLIGNSDWSINQLSWIVLSPDDSTDFGQHSAVGLYECIQDDFSCISLLFSKYVEGSASNKGIEVTNASLEPINLRQYSILEFKNGSLESKELIHFPDTVLLPGESYSLASSNATLDELLDSDTLISATFNGDDALLIIDNISKDTLDVIGVVGQEPDGSAWLVGERGEARAVNQTLVRKSEVNYGSNWAQSQTQWEVLAQDVISSWGEHNIDSFYSCVISSLDNKSIIDSEKQLEKIYTLEGLEIKEVIFYEILIFKYSDGSLEKVYFTD